MGMEANGRTKPESGPTPPADTGLRARQLRAALGNTTLKTRLLVLVLIAILPSTILLGYIEIHVHAERRAHLSEAVLREAELLNADVLSVVEGARQLTLAIAKFPTVEHGDPACRDRLLDLQASLRFYTSISVFDGDGNRVCSTSAAAPDHVAPARLAHIRDVIGRNVFDVGRVTTDPTANLPVLPFCLPFKLADGRSGVVIADLGLGWFSRHLGELNRPPGSTIGIADRNGTTVARFPNPDTWIGKPFPAAPARFINAPHRGSAVVIGFDGKPRLIGFVPASEAPVGLFVSIGLYLPDLIADIDRADWFAGALIACGAILSILLALAIGERFIRRPTEQLLRAARSWSAGNLSARAPLADSPRSEFGRLAIAFNAMAGALGREQERLERTVAERTHELVAANERLQTEIAEREKSEASLLQAQKLQAVGQLAGGIAHDFNNLLGVIIGSLELAVQHTAVVPGFVLRHVNNALNAAGRGAALTKQLLAFSRRQLLSPAALDVNAIIAGMKPLLASTLGDMIEIATELDPALPPALADSSFVESAVLNLAINARDAMPGGGELTIATRLLSSDRAGEPDQVTISVSDTGSGMTPEVMARAFEPFFTTKPPGRGSGLGLSQVHGLAKKSGGDVRIESAPGAGATVTLLLPRAPDGSENSVRAANPAGESPARVRQLHVLIVDDDAEVRLMLEDMLKALGHITVIAADAAEALSVLESRSNIDLLVTDYAMPGMNGATLIEAAREKRPGLHALMVTGYVELARAEPVTDAMVLRKPFHLKDLASHIAQLARSHASDAARSPELNIA